MHRWGWHDGRSRGKMSQDQDVAPIFAAQMEVESMGTDVCGYDVHGYIDYKCGRSLPYIALNQLKFWNAITTLYSLYLEQLVQLN